MHRVVISRTGNFSGLELLKSWSFPDPPNSSDYIEEQ